MPPNVQNNVVNTNSDNGGVARVVEESPKEAAPTRRRGDFDYHIMIQGSAGLKDYPWTEAAVIHKNSTSFTELSNRGNAWGETTLEVNGDSKILQLVGSPPSYGRRPNLRATDVGYRAMDGLLEIHTTYPYEQTLDWTFGALQRSYSGENEKYYATFRERLNHPVLEMYAEKKLNNVHLASNVKVVSFLLILDETQFERPSSYYKFHSAKESEEQFRQEISKLQEKYGTDKIKLYVVSKDDKEEEVMKEVFAKMCEDIENQNGIRFEKIVPLSSETLDPKFETLDKVQKTAPKLSPMVAAPKKLPFWRRIFA